MIWAIARHEFRRLTSSLLFWLQLAFGQLVVAWLAFAQLQAFAEIAPQLKSSGLQFGVTDLVIAPTLNSLVLLLLLATPLLAMSSLAGEVRSGRIALWLAAPVGSLQIASGKCLGLWLASLPLLASCLATLALLGLGVEIDSGRFLLAAVLLLLFSAWLTCINLMWSGLFDHPAAALAASYGVLFFLWLLDSFSDADAPWYWWALLPHLKPALQGLLRSQDLLYFVVTAAAALLVAGYRLARRRGEL